MLIRNELTEPSMSTFSFSFLLIITGVSNSSLLVLKCTLHTTHPVSWFSITYTPEICNRISVFTYQVIITMPPIHYHLHFNRHFSCEPGSAGSPQFSLSIWSGKWSLGENDKCLQARCPSSHLIKCQNTEGNITLTPTIHWPGLIQSLSTTRLLKDAGSLMVSSSWVLTSPGTKEMCRL